MQTIDRAVLDAGMNFLQEQLEHVGPKLYETKYRNIRYSDLVPVTDRAGPGATSISHEFVDARMQAKLLHGASDEIPTADISFDKTPIPVAGGGLQFSYTIFELLQSQALAAVGRDRNIDTRRAQAVFRGIEELAQSVCFLGDTAHGLPGFLNNASVATANATTGTWTTATDPDLVVADVNELLTRVWEDSETIEMPDTLLLPPDRYSLLVNLVRGSVNDTTVMELIQKTNLYSVSTGQPLNIQPLAELEGLGGGSLRRMMAYRKDPDVVEFHYPMQPQMMPPQPRGLSFDVPVAFRISGVELRYPGACGYLDNL